MSAPDVPLREPVAYEPYVMPGAPDVDWFGWLRRLRRSRGR